MINLDNLMYCKEGLCDLTPELEGEKTVENKIAELMAEVESYKQAIQDAKDALASAEQELDDTLAYEYERQ